MYLYILFKLDTMDLKNNQLSKRKKPLTPQVQF